MRGSGWCSSKPSSEEKSRRTDSWSPSTGRSLTVALQPEWWLISVTSLRHLWCSQMTTCSASAWSHLDLESSPCIGQHYLAKFGREAATELGLAEADHYTGHCFRRTSATAASNEGTTTVDLKMHFGGGGCKRELPWNIWKRQWSGRGKWRGYSLVSTQLQSQPPSHQLRPWTLKFIKPHMSSMPQARRTRPRRSTLALAAQLTVLLASHKKEGEGYCLSVFPVFFLVGSELNVAMHKVKVVAYKVKVAVYKVKVAAYKVKVAAYKVKVAAYKVDQYCPPLGERRTTNRFTV